MPAGAQVDAVLSQVDKDIDKSLERLFAHLRIKSISADPAHAEDCKAMAAQFAKEIASLGFSAEVKPTGGHPAPPIGSGASTRGDPWPRATRGPAGAARTSRPCW